MTELDQIKMRIFDQKFSKDGLDCRQVIWLQHFQSVSEVGHRQATAWDEDGWLPLLSHWLLHERDHEGGGSKVPNLYKSSGLRGTQWPKLYDHPCDSTGRLCNLSLHLCSQSQPSCSYASFETNSSSASLGLICQVFQAPEFNLQYGLILGAWDLQSGKVHPELLFNRGKNVVRRNDLPLQDSASFPLHEELKSCSQLHKWKRKELQICNNEVPLNPFHQSYPPQGWELSYANFAAAVI